MAHAHGARSIVQALRAGVRSIEHGSLVDDEGIDLLLERGVPIVPTFLVAEEVARSENVASGATPPWAVQKARDIEARRAERFAAAVERGVTIVMGSDLGLGPHHPAELALMVDHGLSPLAALRSATLDAARLLDLDADLGTLEVGKIADLVLLDFDPLREPSRWRDPAAVRAVIQGGRLVVDRRQDLAAVGVA
jgi:imidazolonepropionase-like amidohydrolase